MFDRLQSAMRSPLLPLALLLLALSTVFVFSGDRRYFYRQAGDHNWISAFHLTLTMNMSPEHGFQRFTHRSIDDDGIVRSEPYNRFPIGNYVSMKLVSLPFAESPSARLYAARILMLLFFTAAAVLAYLSLCRLVSNRWIALTATLLAFSSYHLLYYNDLTANEGMPDLFGIMLTFHGMVVFVQEGRFHQLLIKACIALLLGWHVYALLLPFVVIGLAIELLRARSIAASSPQYSLLFQGKRVAGTLLRNRFLLLGGVALGFGLALLTFNIAMEYVGQGRERPLTELPSFRSILNRTGADSDFNAYPRHAAERAWGTFLRWQFQNVLRMFIPYSLYDPLGYRGDAADHSGRLFRYRGDADESPTWLSESQGVGLGVVLSAACLIGSIFVRPRILFLTLASFGFFWALPMRNVTALHDFEPIYYVGLPLVLFTLILLLARRLARRDGVIAAASVLALLLFTVSSFQMSRIGYNAETAQGAKAADEDFRAIREVTADELVTVLHMGGNYENFFAWAGHAINALRYYLNTSFIRYRYLPPPPPPPRE